MHGTLPRLEGHARKNRSPEARTIPRPMNRWLQIPMGVVSNSVKCGAAYTGLKRFARRKEARVALWADLGVRIETHVRRTPTTMGRPVY